MTTRTTRTVVAFNHAFSLDGVDGELPPGCYVIETEEEQLDTLTNEAYRRLATTITLPAVGTISLRKQIVTIDPEDLAAAQSRDASQHVAPASESPLLRGRCVRNLVNSRHQWPGVREARPGSFS